MGKDLAEQFPAARAVFDSIDAALATPLSTLMFAGPEEDLTATQNAQPAILAHTAAVFAIVRDRVGAGTVVAAAGHSLGEYTAYVTAGALSASEAAKLVRRRGELMQKAGEERPGTMAAVLGLATKDVEAACEETSQQASIAVVANINAPDQTVISGDPDAVTRAGEACKKRGAKRVIALKVSGAFHSPLMGSAKNHLQLALERAAFRDPAFPVVANATAESVKDAARARRLLSDQLTAAVRWVECMQHAARMGGEGARFVEIGPGAVLAGLLKRIVPEANVVSLGTAAEVTKFMEAA
ncbi:MAG: [acyl-carrier-protein] S-malonyltransferase [Gemmatimonadetes bacterium]|nr:MAG: [acyl-carrier-protein] S-malonyltransferase [Gemmatimonadota bacterium]